MRLRVSYFNSDILHVDKQNADAVYVRGMCLYYQDNVDRAFSHFQHVLRLAPDHTKAMDIYKAREYFYYSRCSHYFSAEALHSNHINHDQSTHDCDHTVYIVEYLIPCDEKLKRAKALKQKKEEGNEAFKASRLAEAYNLYTEALRIDPHNSLTNAKLHFNRATVSSKLGRLNESVADCTAALKLDETYLKALLRRAKCHMDLNDFDEAVRDYEKAVKMDKSRAKLSLKKSKRKDYYKILGIDKNASTDDIKKAYRKRALVHHPDRHASASEVEKKEQEKKFKELGEAYGILSDSKKRARYDSGQDLEDMEGGMGCDVDPNNVFQTFFADPGAGGQFSFSSGGFPAGFTFQFG
uniref:J domain-containing protein n=1 Tax=Timema genevievae TaxID=629358 RepID=A0A7R9JQG9_TIMGE|nr:unnamed protein product [Timema genevievae]